MYDVSLCVRRLAFQRQPLYVLICPRLLAASGCVRRCGWGAARAFYHGSERLARARVLLVRLARLDVGNHRGFGTIQRNAPPGRYVSGAWPSSVSFAVGALAASLLVITPRPSRGRSGETAGQMRAG